MPIGFILIAVVAAVASFGGWTIYQRHEAALAAVASYQKQVDAAEAKLEQQAKEAEDAAIQKQSEIVAAFDKGKTEGQAQAKIVYVKGAQYVAADKGLSNPVCVMGADSLQFLNSARADLRTASLAAGPSGLSRSGGDNGPVVRGTVPAVDPGRGAVPGVPQQPAAVRNTGQVPGSGVPPRPVPKSVAP